MSGKNQPPAKPLNKSGQIREVLLSGFLDSEDIKEAITGGLRATKHLFVDNQWIEVPDHQVRHKWAEFVSDRIDGMPIKRQEHITRQVTREEDLVALAKKSPAFRDSLERLLKDIKGEPKQAEPVK